MRDAELMNLMVERVTDGHTGGERAVLSINLPTDTPMEEIARHISRLGDALLERVSALNRKWQAVQEEAEAAAAAATAVGNGEAPPE